MTTKLTHEQACQLRMIPVFMPDYIDAKIREALRWAYDADEPLIELGWRSDESSIWQLSDAGREALAEYDREWVTVRRKPKQLTKKQLWLREAKLACRLSFALAAWEAAQ